MANKEALDMILRFSQLVSEEVAKSQAGSAPVKQPIRILFQNLKTHSLERRKESLIDKASKGNPEARSALKQLVYTNLSNICKSSHLPSQALDMMLSGYYINYFGTLADITSSYKMKCLTTLINENNIFLDQHKATRQDKIRKLAQIIYQELYGLGVLDEFLDLKPTKNFVKVEEIASAGGSQLSLKISGLDVKLDKLHYPDIKIEQVTKRLSKCSDIGLNSRTKEVEAEMEDHSRITLMCAPLVQKYAFNIRRHYPNTLTTDIRIKLGSTTSELEKFLDLAVYFHSRIMVIGPQGAGKSTIIRSLVERFPTNTTISSLETSFELGLENIDKLTVTNFRSGVVDIEDQLRYLFRNNSSSLIMGECRSPADAAIYTQVSTRQLFSSASTWHAIEVSEFIEQFSNALLRGKYVTTENEARATVSDCVDIVMNVSVCDERHGDYAGLRHVKEVWLIPRVTASTVDKLTPRRLFHYDYEHHVLVNDVKLANIHKSSVGDNNVPIGIDEDFLEVCKQRVYDPEKLEVLRSGNYR